MPANVLWCGIAARSVNEKRLLKLNVRCIVTALLYSGPTTMSPWLIRDTPRAVRTTGLDLPIGCFHARAGRQFFAIRQEYLHRGLSGQAPATRDKERPGN